MVYVFSRNAGIAPAQVRVDRNLEKPQRSAEFSFKKASVSWDIMNRTIRTAMDFLQRHLNESLNTRRNKLHPSASKSSPLNHRDCLQVLFQAPAETTEPPVY